MPAESFCMPAESFLCEVTSLAPDCLSWADGCLVVISSLKFGLQWLHGIDCLVLVVMEMSKRSIKPA